MTEKQMSDMTKSELLTIFEQCNNQINMIDKKCDEIIQIRKNLDDGSLLEKIRSAHDESIQKFNDIEQYHKEALSGSEEFESMKTELEETVAQFKEAKKEMLGSHEEGTDSGYIDEIKNSLKEYKKKYNELYQQIETELLSGATTVSLSKNFNDKVEEYKKSRKRWESWLTGVFIFAVVGLFVFSFYMDIPLNTEELIFYIFRTFSVIGIFVWLVVFMGNRRAENRKLEESYKHKEMMARSFSGYRKSIERLIDERDDRALLSQLMSDLLEAIKQDSSIFLSSKGERHPLADAAERVKPSKAQP